MSQVIEIQEAAELWRIEVTTDPDVVGPQPDYEPELIEILRVTLWLTYSEILGWMGFHAGPCEPEHIVAPDGSNVTAWCQLNPFALASFWDQAMAARPSLRERMIEKCHAKEPTR